MRFLVSGIGSKRFCNAIVELDRTTNSIILLDDLTRSNEFKDRLYDVTIGDLVRRSKNGYFIDREKTPTYPARKLENIIFANEIVSDRKSIVIAKSSDIEETIFDIFSGRIEIVGEYYSNSIKNSIAKSKFNQESLLIALGIAKYRFDSQYSPRV
jgi:hypothetical protein